MASGSQHHDFWPLLVDRRLSFLSEPGTQVFLFMVDIPDIPMNHGITAR